VDPMEEKGGGEVRLGRNDRSYLEPSSTSADQPMRGCGAQLL